MSAPREDVDAPAAAAAADGGAGAEASASVLEAVGDEALFAEDDDEELPESDEEA